MSSLGELGDSTKFQLPGTCSFEPAWKVSSVLPVPSWVTTVPADPTRFCQSIALGDGPSAVMLPSAPSKQLGKSGGAAVAEKSSAAVHPTGSAVAVDASTNIEINNARSNR